MLDLLVGLSVVLLKLITIKLFLKASVGGMEAQECIDFRDHINEEFRVILLASQTDFLT